MPQDIHLDDLYDDLNEPDLNPELNPIDIPGGIETEVEENEPDHANLFDLDPSIYEDKDDQGSGQPINNTVHTQAEIDIIADLLRSKGIADPNEINFENENGEIEKRSFYDLPYEEQLGILQSSDAEIDFGLDASESEAISFLRENGVTLEGAITYFQRKAVEDYINSQNISGLEVDQYTDDELYMLHLKTEYPDLEDDEIQLALEKQLEHPDLFKKQVDKLRTDFKEIEAKQLDESRTQEAQIREEKEAELQDTLIDIATNVADIGGLTLDDTDRNEVLHHILNKDMNGVSPFIKSLNSPQQLFELAWFAVKGREAFDVIHDYYKKEIANVSKTAFEKGKQSASNSDGRQQKQSSPKHSFTRKGSIQAPSRPAAGSKEGLSINDIQID